MNETERVTNAPSSSPAALTTTTNAVVSDESVQTVRRNGREYLQFPIVPLQEMVYEYPENGTSEYLPANHIRETLELWNGVPITYVHPQNRDTTAATPNAYTGAVIGAFHDPEFTAGAKLRGNALLDIEKAESVGGLAATVVSKLQYGETLSVSAGYVTYGDQHKRGSFNGNAYDLIQSPPLPDHIAVFPSDEFLARCTPEDGCAAPKANASGVTTNSCGCGCGGHCERVSGTESENESKSKSESTTTMSHNNNGSVFESQREKNRAKQLLMENGLPEAEKLNGKPLLAAAETFGFVRESEVEEYPDGTRTNYDRRQNTNRNTNTSNANASRDTSDSSEEPRIDPNSPAHSIPGVTPVGSRSSYENRDSSAPARARREKNRERNRIYDGDQPDNILDRDDPRDR